MDLIVQSFSHIKYMFDGHSFRSEGLAPLQWNYIDARYVDDVYKKFVRIPRQAT